MENNKRKLKQLEAVGWLLGWLAGIQMLASTREIVISMLFDNMHIHTAREL